MNSKSKTMLILMVIIGLGLSLYWTYRSVESNKENQVPVQELYVTVQPDYEITARKETLLWPIGTVFEQGQLAYYFASMPQFEVKSRLIFSGFLNGNLKASIKVRGLLQAIDDQSKIYWSYPLNQPRLEEIVITKEEPTDQTVEYKGKSLSLNMASIYEEAIRIREELQFPNGFLRVLIESKVMLEGVVNGIEVVREITLETPISLQSNSFSIGKSADLASVIGLIQNTNSNTSSNSLKRTYEENQLPVLVSLAFFIVLFILFFLPGISKTKAAMEHKRYKEWITEGNIEVPGKLQVNIISLQGLVDLAIDIDKRVIYDLKSSKYYVLEEDIVYVYDREQSNSLLGHKQQFGKLLLDQGIISPEQLETGLYYQQKAGVKLGEALLALGFLNEVTLYSILAAQNQMNYYELSHGIGRQNTKWMEQLTLAQARVLKVLPLGLRTDGSLVIATSQVFNKGIEQAMQEIFQREVEMVATRPSRIFEILDRLTIQEQESIKNLQGDRENGEHHSKYSEKITPYEKLTEEEWEQFMNSYYKGKLEKELLLKAAGFINIKNVNTETLNLTKGLERSLEQMNWNQRKQKKVPDDLQILRAANYLKEETVQWIKEETNGDLELIQDFVSSNYLVSSNSLQNIYLLRKTLSSILYKTT